MPLFDTARSILTEASQHPRGIAVPPTNLPAAARHAVLRSLLRQGLVAEYSASADHLGRGWRQADGSTATLQIIDAGRQAIGYGKPRNAIDPVAPSSSALVDALAEPHSESLAAPTAGPVGDCSEGNKGADSSSRTSLRAPRPVRLREAAQAVLAIWGTPEQLGLAAAIDALQAVLASKRPVPTDAAPRTPRPDTK